MIDVTIQNFETEVIAASAQQPVLIDFWAPWCQPCKTLGPILEQIESEYAGRFKLAKVNTQQEQQIAAAFGIRNLPTCILLIGGQPVDGFMGALPASQVRAFLDQHVPSENALQAEAEVSQAEALIESGDTQAALGKLADALAADPGNDDARFDLARLQLASGDLEAAAATLAEALAREPRPLRFDALARLLDALQFAAHNPRGQWPLARFDQEIASNKRDFQTHFDKARLLMAQGQWTQAMDELLEIILRDKNWNDQIARKTCVAILELLTPPPAKPGANDAASGQHPPGIELTGQAARQQDPQAELLSSYRRKLSMALN